MPKVKTRRVQERVSPIPEGATPMSSCCPSCPFRKDERGREACPEVTFQVKSNALKGINQFCHSTPGGGPGETPGPKTKLCRGARDHAAMLFHRLGLLDAPTDEAWDAAVERTRPRRS
jgi:hypothetical protein